MFTPSHLAQLRSLQEAHFTERVKVEQVQKDVLNEDTGKYGDVVTLVWEGRASIDSGESGEVDAAGRVIAKTEVRVKLPVVGTELVRDEHRVTVLESATDTGLIGRVFTLTGRDFGGLRTLRRFPARED